MKQSLWMNSASWRWLLVSTILASAILMLIGPWNEVTNGPLALATYTQPMSVGASSTAVSASGFIVSGPQPVPITNPVISLPTTNNVKDKTFDFGISSAQVKFSSGTELHAIGVYQGALPPGQKDAPWWSKCSGLAGSNKAGIDCFRKFSHQHTEKNVRVNVTRKGVPIVLVLMAYEPVKWKVVSSPGVQIQKIIISGYHGQDIEGVSKRIPIDLYSKKPSLCTTCSRYAGSFYVYKKGSPEYAKVISKLDSLTGLKLTSFQGGHEAGLFTVSSSTAPKKFVPAATERRSDLYLGKTFNDDLMIAGQLLPLPEGKWQGAAFSEVPSKNGSDELLVLAKIENKKLAGLIAVRAQMLFNSSGFPENESCKRIDVYAQNVISNKSFGDQVCYWVTHDSEPWLQPIFNNAAIYIAKHGVKIPGTLINAGFHKANRNESITAFYYSNPEIAGIKTRQTNWSNSPWHPDYINNFPNKIEHVDIHKKWAKYWFPVFKATKVNSSS